MRDEKLLTISQAASRLGIHQNTLRVWADRGMIPVVKLASGYRRFRPSDIDTERRRMGLDNGNAPAPKSEGVGNPAPAESPSER